jgi:MFS family permease
MLANTFGRFHALGRNARLYLLSNLLQAATAGAVAVLYTLFLAELGYGTEFIGLVLVVGTIGGGLGIIPANLLVSRLGYRAMLIWSNVGGGVAIAAQIIAPTPPVILLTTLAIGASIAVVLVINTPLLTAYSTPHERTALLGLNNALNFLAGIVGSLLGGFLPGFFARPAVRSSHVVVALQPFLAAGPQAQTYELAMLTAGALALPSIIPILLMREEHPVRPEPAPAAVTPSPASPAREAATPPRELAAPPFAVSWRKRLILALAAIRIVATGTIGRFAVTQGLLGFGAGLFFPYINLYFKEHLGASTEFIGALSATGAVFIAAASLLAAPLAVRFGKVRLAVVAQLTSLIFLFTVGAVPLLLVAAAALLTRSFCMTLTGPPLLTYYMEAVPERARVLASSVQNVTYQIIWAVGAGVGGLLIASPQLGFASVFFAAIPFYAASALLIALWFGGQHASGVSMSDRVPTRQAS